MGKTHAIVRDSPEEQKSFKFFLDSDTPKTTSFSTPENTWKIKL